MKILAIETSCDDTCAAIIEARGKKRASFKILSNIIFSQIEVHKKWGGVYPMIAKREHQRNLIPVLTKALKKNKLIGALKLNSLISKRNLGILKEIFSKDEILYGKIEKFLKKYEKPDINAIAVTVGPGLEPCLWAGVNAAKALSYFWKIPIIPINHIEAHILANLINENSKLKVKIEFPAVCLVVSGGHTQLILMKGLGRYKIIGETRDDAAGECFDKTARILGLGYPGGPIISAEAEKVKTTNYELKNKLPRPMMGQKNLDFSFSGLKTAVLYKNIQQKNKSQKYKREMCKEIQQSIIDVLIKKTLDAAHEHGAKTIILGGGVSANEELRKQLKQKIEKINPKTILVVPQKKFSTDNAAMIGITGYFRWLKKNTKKWDKISAKANFTIN